MTTTSALPYYKTRAFRAFASGAIVVEVVSLALIIAVPEAADIGARTAMAVAIAYAAIWLLWHARATRSR